MANLSTNHLWLIGTEDRLTRWLTADAWAALSPALDGFGLFHPEHGYPVGRVVTFDTHRNPVSVHDPERRMGIDQDLDQFLSYADEGWLFAGHEWRRRNGRRVLRTDLYEPRSHFAPPPDPDRPQQRAWTAHHAQVFLPEALDAMRHQPWPVARTRMPLVLRRALWRDDGDAVVELLGEPSIRPDDRDQDTWWFGVREAARRRPWTVGGVDLAGRAPGPGGRALHAWLAAMPKDLRALPAVQPVRDPMIDPAVKAALRAWFPVDQVWGMAQLDLPHVTGPNDPGGDAAVLELWNATGVAQQRTLALRWLLPLQDMARTTNLKGGAVDAGTQQRLLDLLDGLVAQRGSDSPLLSSEGIPRLDPQAWPRLARWAEARELRTALPHLPSTVRSRPRL